MDKWQINIKNIICYDKIDDRAKNMRVNDKIYKKLQLKDETKWNLYQ